MSKSTITRLFVGSLMAVVGGGVVIVTGGLLMLANGTLTMSGPDVTGFQPSTTGWSLIGLILVGVLATVGRRDRSVRRLDRGGDQHVPSG